MTPPSLAATAADLVEFADQLGLSRFAVVSASGGGPFALAVAAAAGAGERVTAVAVHAGLGSFVEVQPEVLEEDDRRALELLQDGDVEAAMALELTLAEADLGRLRELSDADFSAALASMAPPGPDWLDERPEARAVFQADFRRAITPLDGSVRDNLSWLGAWDFDLAAVDVPVRLVYSHDDGFVSMAHAEWLRARLPHSELHVIPGGHGDVSFGAMEDSFAAIAARGS
jgi:pimeloyl-ACP methyl ester carboxylesterase